MQKLEQFLRGTDVAMRCRRVPTTADCGLGLKQPWSAKLYACELHRGNGHRPVKTFIGSDNGSPDLYDVVDVVAAEAAVVDDAHGFEDWAVRMGFDPDSRRDERVYRAARHQARLLRRLLGNEAYEQLLWHTERL
jgi:hypothetical protein